jgi:hypothetical protein
MDVEVKTIDPATMAAHSSNGWLRNASLSVLITSLAMIIAIVVGGLSVQYLSLPTGWSFAIAVLVVIGEIWVVLTMISGMRGGSD